MVIEKRSDLIKRKLVIVANGLSLWAGIRPTNEAEHEEILQLQQALENTIAEMRNEAAANKAFANPEQSVKL